MMKVPSISEAEWTVMEVLWESSPRSSAEVIQALSQSTKWAANTIRTLLARLIEKGAVKTTDSAGGTRLYLPAIKRETLVRAESDSFLERIFQGSAQPLLVHFARRVKLSPEQAQELKDLLDQSINEQQPE